MALIYFIVFAATLAGGLGAALARRADHAAFCLMAAMFGIAVNFLFMAQEFLAFAQVIVYVGAIMVLFLFVIMLLNLREPEEPLWSKPTPFKLASVASAAVALFLAVVLVFGGESAIDPDSLPKLSGSFDPRANTQVAVDLFTVWVYPLEIISLLLLAAVIGSIVIARRRPILMIDAAEATPASGPKPVEPPPDAS